MTITLHGPLFDGEAGHLIDEMIDDIQNTVGDEGAQMVRAELGGVLRHPTGRYQSGIRSEPAGAGVDVTDGGIIYGPWLEGIGSRNRTTRFKGYATFRRVAQALQGRADGIAERVADRYIRRLG